MNLSLLSLCLNIFMFLIFDSANSLVWRFVQKYSGRYSDIDYHRLSKRSRIHCAASCDEIEPCIAFIFAKSQPNNCQLLANTLYMSNGRYTNVTDAQFYGMECGTLDGSGYSHVNAKGLFNFAYKVLYVSRSYDESHTKCVNKGGTLFRFTSTLKYYIMRSLVQTCSDYSDYSYRVDGTNRDAADYHNVNEWRFSNNEPLPPTVWTQQAQPIQPNLTHCACLTKRRRWHLNDCQCGPAVTDPFILCEKLIP